MHESDLMTQECHGRIGSDRIWIMLGRIKATRPPAKIAFRRSQLLAEDVVDDPGAIEAPNLGPTLD